MNGTEGKKKEEIEIEMMMTGVADATTCFINNNISLQLFLFILTVSKSNFLKKKELQEIQEKR